MKPARSGAPKAAETTPDEAGESLGIRTKAEWNALTEHQRRDVLFVNVSGWLSRREREQAKGAPAAVRTLAHGRRTCTRTNVTVQEQRDYEDASDRFLKAAGLANALAFERAAEHARQGTPAYSAPPQLRAVISRTQKLREALEKKLGKALMWHGGAYDLPVGEWIFFIGLTPADLRLSATTEAPQAESRSLAVLALNLRRCGDLFSDLARTESPRGRGKADAASTRRLLSAADAFAISKRRLAEVAVDTCDATFCPGTDEELTRDARIQQWLKHFRDVRRSDKRKR